MLDRLTDEDPMNRYEARDLRSFSMVRLRESVLRDLSWLMNASYLAATYDLGPYPHVANSVLNYGIPPTAGHLKGEIDPMSLARQVHLALLRFEPRLLPHSLQVSVIRGAANEETFRFVIESELWAHPVPLRMTLRTEPDRELDMVRVVEQASGGT